MDGFGQLAHNRTSIGQYPGGHRTSPDSCDIAVHIPTIGCAMLQTFRHVQQALDETPHILRLGRLFSETVLIEVDGREFYLVFEKGRLASVTEGPSRKTPWRFALRTDAEALQQFWQLRPEPGFHDIFGLVKIGRGRIDGDILSLVKNLRFFKEVLALPRAFKGESA